MMQALDSTRWTMRKTKGAGVLREFTWITARGPKERPRPLLSFFETKQDPDPAHQHTSTHTHTHIHANTKLAQLHTATHTQTHMHTLVKNGVTGFHGSMRLTDRTGVLTRSQTTERMMERKRKRQKERERGRGSAVKQQRTCRIGEIYHTQAADHPWG